MFLRIRWCCACGTCSCQRARPCCFASVPCFPFCSFVTLFTCILSIISSQVGLAVLWLCEPLLLAAKSAQELQTVLKTAPLAECTDADTLLAKAFSKRCSVDEALRQTHRMAIAQERAETTAR